MTETIRIQMMGSFAVYLDEIRMQTQIGKSRKGISLLEMLILEKGAQVSNQRIYELLWGDSQSANPEAALKTLISRLRASMNALQEGFGGCIVADRGAYHWETRPGVSVDVLEIMDILQRLSEKPDAAERRRLMERLLFLYEGDLLQYNASEEWLLSRETALLPEDPDALLARYEQAVRNGARPADGHPVDGAPQPPTGAKPAGGITITEDSIHVDFSGASAASDWKQQALIDLERERWAE